MSHLITSVCLMVIAIFFMFGVFFVLFCFLVELCSLQDLSSPAGDVTRGPGSESTGS